MNWLPYDATRPMPFIPAKTSIDPFVLLDAGFIVRVADEAAIDFGIFFLCQRRHLALVAVSRKGFGIVVLA